MSETELTSDPQFRDTLRQLETWDDSELVMCVCVFYVYIWCFATVNVIN